MRKRIWIVAVAICVLVLATSTAQCQVLQRWAFETTGNPDGWSVPADQSSLLQTAVMGGSLWLHLTVKLPEPQYPALVGSLPVLKPSANDINVESPRGLDITTTGLQRVRMRVLNLSPVSDVYLKWRTAEQSNNFAGARRCTLKPDVKEWQEVICYFDPEWRGTIDQIALSIPPVYLRGDIWIDWVEIGAGPARALLDRPEISSARLIPKIVIPGVSQDGFTHAFQLLDQCLILDVPLQGFPYPIMRPGASGSEYGDTWYLLDGSTTAAAAKWVNQAYAENVMRGFEAVQVENPDGRIDGEGDSPLRGQVGDQSQAPSYFFELAFATAQRTENSELRRSIYHTMKRYTWIGGFRRLSGTERPA